MSTPPKGFAVAIDGPVGVGKSTTARLVAEKLQMTYIDTGAMYRAVALFNTLNGVDLSDEIQVISGLSDINIDLTIINGTQRIYLNDTDVTDQIRTQAMSEGASKVAVYSAVREKLVSQQKRMAENSQVVMDGRDIGSHVLPWAQVKIYLDASLEVRTTRRLKDLEAKGEAADFETIHAETVIRDRRDKNRTISPLIQTPDAIYIDTGLMPPGAVADTICKIVTERGRIE